MIVFADSERFYQREGKLERNRLPVRGIPRTVAQDEFLSVVCAFAGDPKSSTLQAEQNPLQDTTGAVMD